MSVNSKLFTMCNYPVRMYLEGFAFTDVLKATKLIIIHGGMVATEPDDDTIVLALPSGFSSAEYAKFNISWIHDCISANKFLDIMKYILPTRPDSTVNLHEKSLSERDVQCVKMRKKENSSVQSDSSADTSASLSKSTNLSEATATSSSDVSSKSINEKEIRQKQDVPDGEDNVDVPKVTNNEVKFFQRPTESSGSVSTSTSGDTKWSESSSDSDAEHKQKKRKTSELACENDRYKHYSKKEEAQIVQYLIEHSAISSASEIGIWKKMESEKLFRHRSAAGLKRRFRYHMSESYKNYTNNPRALQEFQRYFDKKMANKRLLVPYSQEENRKMIQYLIDNKAVAVGARQQIWEKMENDEILVKPYRTASALCRYFCRHLRYNYMRYTENPEALKEFHALEKSKQ